MTVTEILQLADELVFAKKGKHLDDLQESIIKGIWQDQTYQEIADECNRSESRVRNIAAKLLQLLSEELGEEIKKTNFRSSLERFQITSSPIIIQTSNKDSKQSYNHIFNFCVPTVNQSGNQENNLNPKSFDRDLTLSPQIINFYNRESELKTLSNYILNQNTHLISVLGLPGIGKTTLVKRFVDLNLDRFEVVIWKSLKFPKSLDLLINDLLNVCKQEAKATLDDKLKQLFDIFTEKRCLIILDDVQNIFIPGELAGQYQNEYQDYQKFFTMLTETQHQSNVILISQESCPEMNCFDEELYSIKSLQLKGLYDVAILNNVGLKDEDSWLNLIELYEGNPLYLKTIASSINNIFDGYVADFLNENELIFTKDMRSNLQFLFNNLSPIEQQIVLKLSNFDQPVSREALKASLELSSTDFINGLESLQQRYLVTKIKQDNILFNLDPFFQEYVRKYSQN